MKIIEKQKFNHTISVDPGDILIVSYGRDGVKVASFHTTIKEKQILDCVVLVEYTPKEAKALGLVTAFGTFAGKSR